MSDVIATVTIATDGGPVVINKSDFDAKTMEIFEDASADDLFVKSLANIDGMNKEALIVALEAMDADTEGKVPELKDRLRTVMTEAYNNGESE